MTPASTQTPYVAGLSAQHQDMVTGLVEKIRRKAFRNRLRRTYYEHKAGLKDLGIAIPPHLRGVETAVGLPAKAVDSMSRRTMLERWTLASGGDPDVLGVGEISEANRLETLMPQAHTSALVASTAFGFVTAGDTGAGEPESLITLRSAEWATGTWSSRLNSMTSALSIVDVDDLGAIDHMVLYVPNAAIVMRRSGARWDIRQSVHELGVPVEQFAYRAELGRPFGRSRISRPVMSLTDSIVRSMLRTEVSAEFFNAPQRWAMGAEEGAFSDRDGNPLSGWQIILGNLLTLSRDEEGNAPTVGEFKQQSMQPNIEQLRMLAQWFASETNLPLRSLGIVGDNPESEGAISEANHELELDIRHWQRTSLSPAWRRLMVSALRLMDDSEAARAEYAGLSPVWLNPTKVTTSAAGDWFVKVAPAIDGLAASTVGMEMAGLSPQQIDRFTAERRRLQGGSTLDRVLAARAEVAPGSDATSLSSAGGLR